MAQRVGTSCAGVPGMVQTLSSPHSQPKAGNTTTPGAELVTVTATVCPMVTLPPVPRPAHPLPSSHLPMRRWSEKTSDYLSKANQGQVAKPGPQARPRLRTLPPSPQPCIQACLEPQGSPVPARPKNSGCHPPTGTSTQSRAGAWTPLLSSLGRAQRLSCS